MYIKNKDINDEQWGKLWRPEGLLAEDMSYTHVCKEY